MESDARRLRGAATRGQLIEAATALFAANGFEGTSIDAVLQAAGVSRGALYHHFASKSELFEAAFEQLEQRIVDEIRSAASTVADPLESLRTGCITWLRIARDPVVQRIVLVDAPAVLGWERYRATEARYTLGGLKAALRASSRESLPAPQLDLLAHVLLSSLSETALAIAQAEDADAAALAAEAVLDRILAAVA